MGNADQVAQARNPDRKANIAILDLVETACGSIMNEDRGMVETDDAADLRREFERVYSELKRVAHRQLLEARGRTLNTTGLVHEAWLKLSRANLGTLGDEDHFLALAARAMRQIVVDHARAQLAEKRGGVQLQFVESDEAADVPGGGMTPEDLLRLDDALSALGAGDPRLVNLIELRFFAGVPVEDIARMQAVSERTLNRDWRRARAQLFASLYPEA
jgi:RNA polymerase sigma factor (TIGR02999 family)